jgi:peptidoglycan/LPS O-acetylase OafA/YrhL
MSPAAVARRHLAGCAVLFASGFVSRGLISALNPQWRSISFEWLPTNIDVFAVGMALAVLSAWAATDDRLRARLDRLARVGELWWLAAIGLFAWYVVRVGPVPLSRLADPNGAYRGWYWQQRQLVLGVVSGLLLVPAVFGSADRGLLRAVLRCRPVAWVGLMSYGLYLWHFGFMNLAVEQRDPATNALLRGGWLHTPARNSNILVVGGIGLGLGLLAALISFYAMERPLERLKSLVR